MSPRPVSNPGTKQNLAGFATLGTLKLGSILRKNTITLTDCVIVYVF
ncbi:hypothetical protein RQN30_06360 [Arcanobacterium hippocoleae]